MPGNKGDFIAQWPQTIAYGIDELLMIAFGKVGSADGSAKQNITHKRDPGFHLVKHNMARGMARTVIDVEGQVSHSDLVTIFQPPVGFEDARLWHPPLHGIRGQAIDPELLFAMGTFYGYIELLLEILGC